MNFSKNMMIKISLSIIGLLFIPLVMMQREYFAIGGEIFLPFIPLMLFGIPIFVKELREILKGGETDD
mgnify:CR=1 FL=1